MKLFLFMLLSLPVLSNASSKLVELRHYWNDSSQSGIYIEENGAVFSFQGEKASPKNSLSASSLQKLKTLTEGFSAGPMGGGPLDSNYCIDGSWTVTLNQGKCNALLVASQSECMLSLLRFHAEKAAELKKFLFEIENLKCPDRSPSPIAGPKRCLLTSGREDALK